MHTLFASKREGIGDAFLLFFSGDYNMNLLYYLKEASTTFSVRGQTIDILGFVYHMVSV